MNDFEPIKFKIMMSASTEIDHVIVEDIDQKFIETYLSPEELSKCNHRTVDAVKTVMQSGRDKLGETFKAIEKRIKFDCEREFGATRVNAAISIFDGAYVLVNGDTMCNGRFEADVELKNVSWGALNKSFKNIIEDAISSEVDDEVEIIYDILF